MISGTWRRGPRGLMFAVLFTAVFVVCVHGCVGERFSSTDYSPWPTGSRAALRNPSGEFTLSRVFRLGGEETLGPSDFAFVTDVGLSGDGRTYVVDQRMARVSVFDSSGEFLNRFGVTGAGPGEFLAPFKIVVFDSSLAVYDNRLGRISIFDLDGKFLSSFPLSGRLLSSLSAGPGRSLVGAQRSAPKEVVWIDLSGRVLGEYVDRPKVNASIRGSYVPDPGAACRLGDGTIIYANPWIYEIAAIRFERKSPLWIKTTPSDIMRPRDPDLPGVTPYVQGGVIMGLECGPESVVFAYLDRGSRALVIDILGNGGDVTSSLEFSREGGGEYPGYVAALAGDRLATFRTQPFPSVTVYRLGR
jgi:6-bladed beta-propeller protein